MASKKLSQDKTLFYSWLNQYRRTHPEDGDVLEKLQYLKEKLTEYKMRDCITLQVAQAIEQSLSKSFRDEVS
ncbi:MAG: hypothetical protein ACE5PV_21990 [Candidatus Poribacteria bacterium]